MKVLKKKKVSQMKSTTAVTNPTTQQIPPDVVAPNKYKSIIGQICMFVKEQRLTPPPQSTLARIVSQRTPESSFVPISHRDPTYVAFCNRAGINNLPLREVNSHAEKTYNHYAAYCKAVDVEPRSRERYERFKDDCWVCDDSEAELRLKILGTKVDSLLRQRTSRRHHFCDFATVLVGVKDGNTFGEKKLRRKVDWVEDTSGYHGIWWRLRPLVSNGAFSLLRYTPEGNKERLAYLKLSVSTANPPMRKGFATKDGLYGAALNPITPRCEWEPAKPVERPITLFAHLSRSAYRPSLQEVNTRDMNRFEYRNNIGKISTLVNRKFKDPVTTTPCASLWCGGCLKYVGQFHKCLRQVTREFERAGCVYKDWGGCCPANDPLTIEWRAKQLLLAAPRRRFVPFVRYEGGELKITPITEEHQQRIWFPQFTQVAYCRAVWAKSVATFVETDPMKHKIVWARSFATLPADISDCVVHREFTPGDLPIDIWLPPLHCVDALHFESITPCTPRTKKHYGVRSFTFTTGGTIKICLCTKFDDDRIAVLKNGKLDKATPVIEALWSARLDALGLSMNRGEVAVLTDHIEELTNSYSNRVNTTSDSDGGKGKDSNARDRRARAWFTEQQEKKPKTESLCRYCGVQLFERVGTHHCPDTDCRQRFWEEWDAGLRMDLYQYTLEDDSLMRLWLDIEKNRS
jgi:hypothetical protein